MWARPSPWGPTGFRCSGRGHCLILTISTQFHGRQHNAQLLTFKTAGQGREPLRRAPGRRPAAPPGRSAPPGARIRRRRLHRTVRTSISHLLFSSLYESVLCRKASTFSKRTPIVMQTHTRHATPAHAGHDGRGPTRTPVSHCFFSGGEQLAARSFGFPAYMASAWLRDSTAIRAKWTFPAGAPHSAAVRS